jgi:hypothetical protein
LSRRPKRRRSECPANGAQGDPATAGFYPAQAVEVTPAPGIVPAHETKPEDLMNTTNSANIKPIPTLFNGIKFRSRLEARWAVFFDFLGLNYFYEYEGFRLGVQSWSENKASELWYVPDFYLPKMDGKRDYWFEIKPYCNWQKHWNQKISQVDLEKIQRFSHMATELGADFGVLGEIYTCTILKKNDNIYADSAPQFAAMGDFGWCDSPYYFCRCDNCNAIGFEFEGRVERTNCCDHTSAKHKHRTYSDCKLLDAYRRASSYQFEAAQ